MSSPQFVRLKVGVATLCLLILIVLSKFRAVPLDTLALGILISAVIVALSTIWLSRNRSQSITERDANRLRILSKSMLSPRCGVVLIEADGKSYLVVYGDGFAQIHEASSAEQELKSSAKAFELDSRGSK